MPLPRPQWLVLPHICPCWVLAPPEVTWVVLGYWRRAAFPCACGGGGGGRRRPLSPASFCITKAPLLTESPVKRAPSFLIGSSHFSSCRTQIQVSTAGLRIRTDLPSLPNCPRASFCFILVIVDFHETELRE